MPAFKLIPVGSIFGKLRVIGGPVRDAGRVIRYPCLCECGQQTLSIGGQLTFGVARSCGCARKETLHRLKTTHGESKSRLHIVWCGMKSRCSNPAHISYKYYGGKGIRVVGAFLRFESFKKWSLANGYKEGLTLDRKKGNKPYSPSNCRWVDWTTQNRGSTSTHMVSFSGRTLCLEEWSELTGINAHTIRGRLKRGWPIWRALTKGKTK